MDMHLFFLPLLMPFVAMLPILLTLQSGPTPRTTPRAAFTRPLRRLAFAVGIVGVLGSLLVPVESGAQRKAPTPAAPTQHYWVYVGAESADKIHRIRFGPDGTVVEKTIGIGELAAEMEGPHGLAISADGKYLHMTTGHGFPDGKYWRYELGPDTLVGPGALLGNFPASLDVTPDGLYAIAANFNLHGDMVPSTMSVVYTPTNTEVARTVTCVMPHGSRITRDGRFQYSGCMMDDQLVEIDTRTFQVSRRFSVAKGAEGPLDVNTIMAGMAPAADASAHAQHGGHGEHAQHNAQKNAQQSAPPRAAEPPVDPAQLGGAAFGMKHDMAPNSCSPTWAQPSADDAIVFVACNKADEILAVDRASWRVVRRIASGRGPYNLAVSPDGKFLVATLKQGHGIQLFDVATGASLATLPTSTTVAHGVTISSDSRYAFVSSEGVGAAPGKVDVVDLVARRIAGTADVGQQASGIAFWKSEPAKR
jgi:DNA-binding beta-propeller fold protein YncE